MDSAKKIYLFAWAALGVAFPETIMLIGHYRPELLAHIPRFATVPITALVFLSDVLGLYVGVPLPLISPLVLLLNAAVYAGFDWLLWWIATRWR